ncbi:Mis12-Mtw1 domain-containing protein [Histoplasma capsulatum G186AR]|uniref:Mis12-Mtw1 domain-containing protein n=1 Tax=Ajellomyces capsulatus (strain G186AR / H82 / ATCC MYA-2454 / RMSCC 2432) TaxID=447093 RepID=C0NPR5_AJECG|nr:Mis12-Mtw1 domain-containing protein [Histoplasma capsulatum G186AR]EEH06925.1 Mis12-Mtw1 domain-containing protein [Histoplasma capsulatum G186AR]
MTATIAAPAATISTRSTHHIIDFGDSRPNRYKQGTTHSRVPLTTINPAMSQARGRLANGNGTKKSMKGGDGYAEGGANGWGGKRKAVEYDEDVEGFQFTRATVPKKSKSVTIEENSVPPLPRDEDTQQQPVQKQKGRGRPPKSTEAPRNVTFETPNGKLPTRPLRRTSKRLAEEEPTATVTEKSLKPRRKSSDIAPAPIMVQRKRGSSKAKGSQTEPLGEETEGQVTTPLADVNTQKIALPFADTPVIQKNKEMRMEKSQKGQRRSSLGRRGRRASWLIESGVSNALPHDQVDTAHFYKHIECEGLSEPKRMRQLLTWCATRALGEKPSGSRSGDESARLAARVIQEELLEDFANRPELSDWFGRQETTPPAVVVKKPNPRNIQNAEKIKELEEQIHKATITYISLTATVNSKNKTSVFNIRTKIRKSTTIHMHTTNRTPTAQTDSSCTSISNITSRLSHLTTSLIPTLDSFASGIHDIELFRRAADDVAGQVLAICARLLEERDQLRQKRIGGEELGSSANGRTMRTRRRKGKQKVGEAAEDDEGAGDGGDADGDEKDDLRIEKEDLAIVLAALKVDDSAHLEPVNIISQAYPPIVFED